MINIRTKAEVALADRELACRLAAQVCQGAMPTGTTLLGYMILIENYLSCGATETAEMMGWDVAVKPPVVLAEVRNRLKDILDGP